MPTTTTPGLAKQRKPRGKARTAPVSIASIIAYESALINATGNQFGTFNYIF